MRVQDQESTVTIEHFMVLEAILTCKQSREKYVENPWIIERLDRKLMSRGLISYRRLVGSCSKMALDGSIIVEICDETMAKMWRKPVEM